jgi:hypothetical protein
MGTVSWIILGVVFIVIIFLFYLYWSTNNLVIYKTDLNTSNPSISKSNISGATNLSYTYSSWVWVNSWNETTPHCIVYAPAGTGSKPPPQLTNGTDMSAVMKTNDYDFALYLDKNSPSLYCTVGAKKDDPSNTIVVTNNFPLQTWVYVVICVQNNLVDCYLNGKLITSQQTNQKDGNAPVTPSFENIYLGNGTDGSWDCQLINFQRSPTVVNPQEVWTAYLAGNGQSMFSSLNSYGVQVGLTKNNNVTKSYTLF